MYKKQKDRAIFDNMPGTGPKIAPRLLVASGHNRERYNDVSELQKYTVIAFVIVIERNGRETDTLAIYLPYFFKTNLS
ncbi:hypothetical protein H4J51_08960 [Colwellia sp. MB02u-18]|uniref:hypothetical protein n=1 Tax=unclassified Colwellia TaxID=196834 RepID=UPI0015F60E75|nr:MULTISPECIES: hypothetical protein [unclassified Colwellia]MBA6225279.1 hypothetical protein [Colwellia sp. MB3u-45]MBA6267271.1 hypothetical protein [Colwellia sp. MB3u-43]MBA6322883.1 hypothetical protein [Colwellia sp. MB02u-19]MBA6324709.1 hypothetical protein [Colwellia sp. MB02u-18]MBA6331100.1 hypothetical protein [Colwellia sp. MB02u-12]